MKKFFKRMITTVVILLFLYPIFYFVNVFFGNPISAFTASNKIKAYTSSAYPVMDLELTKVNYNFPNNSYGCYAYSKDSEDTTFYIRYSHGVVTDDYSYEVSNHFTTYRRLCKELNLYLSKIISKECPFEATYINGDLIGDTALLTPDEPLDFKNMPLSVSLTVFVLSDNRDVESMAVLLTEIAELMQNNEIKIDTYTLKLEEPIREDEGKPGSGKDLFLKDFPAKYITDDKIVLEAVIKPYLPSE